MAKSLKVLFVFVMISLLATACGLLGQNTPSPASGTPNATLTALFDLSQNLPSSTPPGIATATQQALPTVGPTTLVPTPTQKIVPPTPTPTAKPPERSGILMKAAFLSTAPTIDGSWAEWKDKTTQYGLDYVVWGRSNWSGKADLEAAFIAGWDKDYLYVAFKVYDDIYVQNASGKNMYKGDSLELLVDSNLYGDVYSQQLSSDDYQLGISGGNTEGLKPEAYLWFPTSKEGDKTNVKIAYQFDGTLYRAEAAIPWSVLGVTPTADMVLGFAASVNDNDNKTENLQQTMISTDPNRVLADPTTWGWITLVK